MNKKIVYYSLSVWALFSACTGEQADIAPEQTNDKIIINATARNSNSESTDDQPFEKGQMIVIYNGVQPKDVSDEKNVDKIGIYQATEKRADAWVNLPLEREEAQGLWKSDMTTDNTSGKIIFTAIPYKKGQELAEEGKHAVGTDQTTWEKILENDFVVARKVYEPTDWNNNNYISLKFHHVLSRLDVKLYLPIGSANDGYFDQASINNIINGNSSSVLLKDAALDYNISYAYPALNSDGLAGINRNENVTDQKNGNIQMYLSEKDGSNSLPDNKEAKAAMLHFQCMLPKHQNSYTGGSECLTIKIGGKTYTYRPENSTIMSFEQERITTIYLVLYSQKGQTVVQLAGVKVNPWTDDKANVGDLIEQ